jgi:aspartate aminotransferase
MNVLSAVTDAGTVPTTPPETSGSPISARMQESTARSSWIRRMSEEANRQKALYGPESVFDFSLGNPNTEPPAEFHAVLEDLLFAEPPGAHGYMPNAGYPEARRAVAEYLSLEQGVEIPGDNVVMTCGAAGGLNVIFRTILDPADEVIVSRPYFVEYGFYVDNHAGVLRPVRTTEDFGLDLEAIEAAIGPKTRAVLINSPNNPTGRVYSQESVAGLGQLLARRSRETGRLIYLISDEPYRKIVYDGVEVPSVLRAYENAVVVSSYSKELSLAGERIGYLAANPAIPDVSQLMEGLIMANRVLGFVNAPALMQRAVTRLQGACVDLSVYKRNRQVLLDALRGAGYSVPAPEGGFYLFPRSPIADDIAFATELAEHRVIVVPGTGFGLPGYFRISYCVAPEVVDGAVPVLREGGMKHSR